MAPVRDRSTYSQGPWRTAVAFLALLGGCAQPDSEPVVSAETPISTLACVPAARLQSKPFFRAFGIGALT
jgi:hypothetical protein